MAYTRKNWASGDLIEAAALNNLESGVGAAAGALDEIEALLAQGDSGADYESRGRTPYTVQQGETLRLVSAAACAYEVHTVTAADIESAQITFEHCSVSTANGYYKFTNDTDVTTWYLARADVRFTGLTAGGEYTLIIDCLGREMDLENSLQYGYFVILDGDGHQLTTLHIQGAARNDLSASTVTFTVPGEEAVVRIFPGTAAVEADIAACNFNSMWLNRAGAGTAHTEICNRTGAFIGATVLTGLPAGAVISADPACSVSARLSGNSFLRIKGRHAGKRIVCFGDSVTGNMAAPDDYPSLLAAELGAHVVNGGFGGCRMSDTHPTPAYAAFGMCKLAEAVAGGSWALQEQYAAQLSAATHAEEHLAALEALDWSAVDIVTIAFGTNDIQGGVSLDDSNNPRSKQTYLGALRYALDTLLTAYPQLRVLLLTPIYRYWNDEDRDSDEKIFAGSHPFTDWGDGLLAVAAEYKLPALDLYRTAGFNRLTRGVFFPAADGTHPNALGQRRLAEKIAAGLLAAY